MAQARQILTRIGSVKNTQKITRAMKMVAAAKLTRAQQRMESARPYNDGINRIFAGLASDLFGDEHPLLVKREAKRVLNIVIAGDRGLCGGFNNNVLRRAAAHREEMSGVDHVFFAVGKRAISGMKKQNANMLKRWYDVFDKLSFLLSNDIAKQLLDMFEAKEEERVDEVYLIYNSFVSRMTQHPVVRKIMPIDLDAIKEDEKKRLEKEAEEALLNRTDASDKEEAVRIRPVYEIEPSPAAALSSLIMHHISTEVYHAIIESYASELSARMAAMDNATNSADEMIETLTLEYNRARQAGITNELLDIIGGANALDG